MSETILPPTCPFATPDRASRDIRLAGRCSINGGADEPCEMMELAIDHLSVLCAAAVDTGAKVMFSFSEFGLVEATVTSTFEDGFKACFEVSSDSKLAIYLACLQDTSRAADEGTRSSQRIVPVKKVVTLGISGEPERMARIINLSRSGVSITTSKDLVPEQPIMVGPRPGRVGRVFAGGAAVVFDELIPEQEFDPLIELRASES